MSDEATAPVYDPQGTLRDIPLSMLQDAVKAGGVPAHPVQAPDGSTRMIPVTRLNDAVQAGGKILPLQNAGAEIPKAYGFTFGNMANNAWEGAKSVVKGTYDVSKDLIQNPDWFTGPNSTYEKFVGAPGAAEAQKATQAFKEGRYSEAAGHELAGAIPFVGPAAAQIGEQAGTGDVGGAAAKGTAQAVTPMLLSKGAGLVRKAAAPVMQATAEKIYQSGLKPSTTNTPAEVKSMVQTGLQNEIPVSEAGLAKLGDLISDLNDKIKQQIQAGSNAGATVNKFAVASRLGDTAKRFSTQVNPEADLNAVSESGNEFLRNQPAQIPAADAQALKQGTYAQLKDKSFGEMQTATKESQKALARGIKEELAQQFPELSTLNAQDSKFYGLDDALERAVNRISNRNIISLGGKVITGGAAGAAGAMAGGASHAVLPAATVMVVHEIISNPALQTKLAIAMSRASNGKLTFPEARARVQSYATGLGAGTANAQVPDGQTNQ